MVGIDEDTTSTSYYAQLESQKILYLSRNCAAALVRTYRYLYSLLHSIHSTE
jgi:hypothetical protein